MVMAIIAEKAILQKVSLVDFLNSKQRRSDPFTIRKGARNTAAVKIEFG